MPSVYIPTSYFLVMLLLNLLNLLTARLVKEFDREIKDEESRNTPEVTKQLNDEKQSMVTIKYAF